MIEYIYIYCILYFYRALELIQHVSRNVYFLVLESYMANRWTREKGQLLFII